MIEQVSTATRNKTLDEQRAILSEQAKASAGSKGRIANESPTSVVITKGEPVSGIIHPILTGFTLGVWGIVWFLLRKFGGEKRWRLSVDEYGVVTSTRI